jgi:uncharacterized protein YbjT (DUF2867 family)
MILVVGATGQLGSMITRRLLSEQNRVRILVRPKSPYQTLVQEKGEPVLGDLKDPDSLTKACRGVTTVITTATSALRGGEDNVQSVDLIGNRNLINAAKSAGVNQFIFTSALGSDVNNPDPLMQAKAKTETYLRESGMPYTILVPNLFMEVWVSTVVARPLQTGETVFLVGEGRRRHTFVSMKDVAMLATKTVNNPKANNQRLLLAGPQALSWRDVIITFESMLGRKIPVEYVPIGYPVPGLPETIVRLLTAMDTFDSLVDTSETVRTFGLKSTTMEEFVNSLAI